MSIPHSLSRPRGRRRSLPGLRLRRPNRRFFVVAALAAVILGGLWMWLRDSSFVAVREVQVTGTESGASARIREALQSAGRSMTTLHVDEDALRRAVAGFPSVAGITTRTDLPHKLVVEVTERRPAAVLAAGGSYTAVTGNGLLLRDVGAPDTVPEIDIAAAPAGARVSDRRVLAAIAVAAAAPPVLRARVTTIGWGPRGLHAELESGPPLIFGTAADAALKWDAAARVLADPSSAGATYLDLRVVGRVAAGGLGPVVPEAGATPQSTATPAVTATPSPYPQP
jgi:cell division protein FtsQ